MHTIMKEQMNIFETRNDLHDLIEFLTEVLKVLDELGITPFLSGSLAVYYYTREPNISVKDIDLACSERYFEKIIEVLEELEFDYKLRDWHVLQICKKGLKIELDSIEYWYQRIPTTGKSLKICENEVKILSLESLIEFYEMGMNDKAGKSHQKKKYEDLRRKYQLLKELIN